MKTLAALFVVAALALSACDGGDVIPDPSGMAGAAGAVDGTAGAVGAAGAGAGGAADMRGSTGGAGGAGYTPDPLDTCSALTMVTQLCAGFSATTPTFNSTGSACVLCGDQVGRQVDNCAIRDPFITHSNGTTTGTGRDKVCMTVAGCGDCH